MTHAICSSMEALKSALKHLWKPRDMGPAVKIWAWDCHPCSKHCVFVCQRLILLLPSHLHILSLHPPLYYCIQIHSVRSDRVFSKDKSNACVHLDGVSALSKKTMYACWFGELCFSLREGAQSYRNYKEINRIDSSLAQITLAFILHQILFRLFPRGKEASSFWN